MKAEKNPIICHLETEKLEVTVSCVSVTPAATWPLAPPGHDRPPHHRCPPPPSAPSTTPRDGHRVPSDTAAAEDPRQGLPDTLLTFSELPILESATNIRSAPRDVFRSSREQTAGRSLSTRWRTPRSPCGTTEELKTWIPAVSRECLSSLGCCLGVLPSCRAVMETLPPGGK